MSRIPDFKRITVEDFPAEDQQTIGKLAFPINSFFEQIRGAFNKAIDFNNLNQEVVTLSFTTNELGQPINALKFKTTVSGRINGMLPISLKILSNNEVVTQAPFVNFTQNERFISILHISGLKASTRYEISLLVI